MYFSSIHFELLFGELCSSSLIALLNNSCAFLTFGSFNTICASRGLLLYVSSNLCRVSKHFWNDLSFGFCNDKPRLDKTKSCLNLLQYLIHIWTILFYLYPIDLENRLFSYLHHSFWRLSEAVLDQIPSITWWIVFSWYWIERNQNSNDPAINSKMLLLYSKSLNLLKIVMILVLVISFKELIADRIWSLCKFNLRNQNNTEYLYSK